MAMACRVIVIPEGWAKMCALFLVLGDTQVIRVSGGEIWINWKVDMITIIERRRLYKATVFKKGISGHATITMERRKLLHLCRT